MRHGLRVRAVKISDKFIIIVKIFGVVHHLCQSTLRQGIDKEESV